MSVARVHDLSSSADYIRRAGRLIPFGVSSSKRATQQPTPVVIDRAEGSRVFDIAGNEYLDYAAGAGPMLLGHRPVAVLDAVRAQLDRGWQYAAAHEGELELAERVVRAVPCAEMVTFLSSGSEAVHCAVGIARGATRRRRVLKFDGQFDGWMAPVAANMPGSPPVEGRAPFEVKPVAGWHADDLVVCPWNDVDALEEVMAQFGPSLAAVIMEAVACNAGSLFPSGGYLERVRELCDRHGTVLIFDEVITGFRLALGGAQARVRVTPDLATFAKAMANGFPISAVAGRREVMSVASDGPVRTRGTYNGNPLSVAAANATLAELERRAGELYPELERRSADLAEGLLDAAAATGAPLRVNRAGSVVGLFWGLDREPTCYREVAGSDVGSLKRLEKELVLRGINTIDGERMFVSAAHTDGDITATVETFREALHALIG